MENIKPICTGCNLRPEEIEEYITDAEESDMTPDDYVKTEEGTYNETNGHFLCTDCYIRAGMPALPYPQKWIAP